MANHITQEAYIKRIVGSGGFWLFHNDPIKGYVWEPITNYSHPLFMYNKGRGKAQLSKYDPEKKGRGTNLTLSRIESTLPQNLNLIQTSGTKHEPLNEIQVNDLIIAGIQMVARFSAMRMLEKQGVTVNGEGFEAIMESLINNSNILIKPPRYNWREFVDSVMILNQGMADHTREHYVDKLDVRAIIYGGDVAIIGDCPALYSHSLLVYPRSSQELISFRIKSEWSDGVVDALLDNACRWIDLVCQNSELYLIAHSNISTDIRDTIYQSYVDGYYSLIQI